MTALRPRLFLLLLPALLLLAVSPAQAQPAEQPSFTAEAISDSLFARMQGRSWPQECTLSRSELCCLHVLHYDLDGHVRRGELVCNVAIAADLLDIFRALYEARYPIGSLRLIDDFDADDNRSMAANNSSCFCYRRIAGSQRLSRHSLGLAVDINPLYNPWVRTVNGRTRVAPVEGTPYADRKAPFPCKLTATDLCTRLFLEHGFTWGGTWKNSKDYQHFEKSL